MDNNIYIVLQIFSFSDILTFEGILKDDLYSREFGTARYTRAFKKRPHVSRSKIDSFSNSIYLNVPQSYSIMDFDSIKLRYIACVSLVYDIMMSIYDVNSRSLIAARFLDLTPQIENQFSKFIKSLKRPNLELRVIGLQDGQEHDTLRKLVNFIKKEKLQLYEIDLFGKEIRNIAIDAYTGMSFNILLEDRVYKPGELTNSMTREQFEKNIVNR